MNGEDLLGWSIWEFERQGPAGSSKKVDKVDDGYHGEWLTRGISVVATEDGTIDTVQLHRDGHGDHTQYDGDLPQGLTFAMGRPEVREALGDPESSGAVPSWDRFDAEIYLLHVDYEQDESSIQMISLMRQASAPAPLTVREQLARLERLLTEARMSDMFEHVDADLSLLRRQQPAFEKPWDTALDDLSDAEGQIDEDTRKHIKSIREEAYRQTLGATDDRELAAAVAEDFGLIADAIALGTDDPVALSLLSDYVECRFPDTMAKARRA